MSYDVSAYVEDVIWVSTSSHHEVLPIKASLAAPSLTGMLAANYGLRNEYGPQAGSIEKTKQILRKIFK